MKKIILPPLILFLALLLVLLSACTYPMGSDLIEIREYKIANIEDKVKIGTKEKEIAYTDENEGETFIIKTDKKDYYSWGGDIMVHFSITNVSENNQDAYVVFSLGDKQFVRSIEVFEGNKTVYELIPATATSSEQKIAYETPIWSNISFDAFDVSKTKIVRKDTKDRDVDKVFKGSFKVSETKYYRATMRVPYGISENEWFIEAFGDLNDYGNLDPNNWTLEDKFNSDTKSTGDLNGQDNWSGSGFFDVVTTDDPYEGDQHIKLTDSGDAWEITNAFSGIVSGTMYVSMKAKITTNSQPKFYLETDGAMYHGPAVKLDNSGDIETALGAKVGSETYSADTYVRIGIQFECGAGSHEGLSADTYKVNVDDGTWYGPYSYSTAQASVVGIILVAYGGNSDEEYFDYVSYEYGGAAPPVVTPVSEESDWIIYN